MPLFGFNVAYRRVRRALFVAVELAPEQNKTKNQSQLQTAGAGVCCVYIVSPICL